MIKSGFFDSKGGDRRYTSQDMAYIFQLLMTNGVYANPATSLQVVAGTNMTIKVSAGFGVINGRYAYNTADYNITLANANGTYGRIDRIVLRMNMTDRAMQLVALTGTPASAPVAPAVVRDGTFYDLSLATITVAAGATVIPQNIIVDTRNNVAICGYITGAVDQIDTTGLFAQYEAEWTLLRAIVAQDSEAIAEALAGIEYIKTVGGKSPDENKNVSLELADVHSETLIFNGAISTSTEYTMTQPYTNFNYLRLDYSYTYTKSFLRTLLIPCSNITPNDTTVQYVETQMFSSNYDYVVSRRMTFSSTTKFIISTGLTSLKIYGVN